MENKGGKRLAPSGGAEKEPRIAPVSEPAPAEQPAPETASEPAAQPAAEAPAEAAPQKSKARKLSVGAGDWGRGIAVRYRSLRQRYALPPPSQREARGNGFPRQCAHWLGMTGERGGQGRPPLQGATGNPQWTKVSAAQLRTLLYKCGWVKAYL